MAHARDAQITAREIVGTERDYGSRRVDTRFCQGYDGWGCRLILSFTTAKLDENGDIEHEKILEKSLGYKLRRWDTAGLSCKIHAVGELAR